MCYIDIVYRPASMLNGRVGTAKTFCHMILETHIGVKQGDTRTGFDQPDRYCHLSTHGDSQM